MDDFAKFRKTNQDESLGATVVCDSVEQARQLSDHFQTASDHNLITTLILHDVDTKNERDQWVKDSKTGRTDTPFMYNMLLTDFDAPRLKKLYLGKFIKTYNLLQTLTRVNCIYKSHRHGYVVDFADIECELDKTNHVYWDELSNELGGEIGSYSQLFKTAEEIEQEIAGIKNALFDFDTENAEELCNQISQVVDKKQLLALKKALQTLLAAGFATRTLWVQWPRLPIYLKAMTLRLEKYSGNPSRDVAREADIQELEQMWQERTNSLVKQG